jgi:hypothetical protein
VFTTPTKPHAEFADFVESGFGDYVSLPHPGYANIFPPALRQRDDRSERETKEMRFMEIPSNTFRCSARRWPFKAHRWLADSVEMQHTDISQNTVYWLNLTCQGCGTRERTASLRVAEILASTLFTLSDDAKRGLGIAVPEVDLATAEIVRHPETGDQHLVPLERNEEYGWFMRWLYKERDFTTPLRWACRPLTAPIALVRGYMERVKREPFNWLGGPLLVLGMAGILPAVLGTAAYVDASRCATRTHAEAIHAVTPDGEFVTVEFASGVKYRVKLVPGEPLPEGGMLGYVCETHHLHVTGPAPAPETEAVSEDF